MDDTRPPSASSPNPAGQDQLSSVGNSNPAGLYSSDMNKYYLDSSLEVKQQPGMVVSGMSGQPPPKQFITFTGVSRHKAVVISAVITLVVTAITGASIVLLARNAPDRNAKPQVATQDVSIKDADPNDIPKELQGADKSLLVNGDVITKGSLKVASGGSNFVTVIKSSGNLTSDQTFTLPNGSGTLCLDSNNCNNASLDQLNQANAKLTDIQAQLGQLNLTPNSPTAAGVGSLNGQTGLVTIQGSTSQITVNTAGGVITLSTPQNLDANANVQFNSISANTFQQTGAGNNVSITAGNDSLTFTSNGRTFTLPSVGGAVQEICTSAVTCAAGGGQALILSPGAVQTDNNSNASIFINDTGGGNLIQIQQGGVNKLIVNNSGDVTVSGSLTVQGLGSGIVHSTSGVLSIGGVNLATTDVTGTLPVSHGGLGVTTLASDSVLLGNGTGVVQTATPSGSGQCLISNPSSAPSFQACPGGGGVTSLNSQTSSITLQGTTNQVSVNTAAGTITLSTPQNIHTGATPTFAGLTLTGLGTGIVRATSGVISAGSINLGTEVTGTLPAANGGTGVSTTPTDGKLLIGNTATSSYSLANLTAGSGINIVNGNGSITISSPSGGTCPTCANASLSNLTSVAINTDLLPGSTGIGLGSTSKGFDDLYLDVATGTGSLRLIAANSTPGNYTVTFPDATGTVCLSTGNCAGVGGSVGGSGTNNRLAKFTSTGSQIGDSNISDNGTTVSVTGAFSVSTSAAITGALTAGSFNALSLQSNATGFQLSGGTSSKTLTVVNDVALNQNLRTTDNPTFASLTLSTALSPANGGTGVAGGPTADGQILIGSAGGTYTRSTISAGSGITVTNGAGSIQISSPLAGTCTVGCADQALHNLASVSINVSLMPDSTQTINLGSTMRPFQSLHLNDTAGSQGFLITGHNTGSEVTLTLPTLNGTLALVQSAGSSSAQTGDINVNGSLIANRLIGTLLGSNDTTSSSAVTFRSGNASAGNSGDVTIDVGTATGTTGSIAIGNGSASAITLGRTGLAVQFPGGINTQTADIATGGGNLDLGSGTITSGTINGQTLDSTLSELTGSLRVYGFGIGIGGSQNGVDGRLALLNSTDAEVDLAISPTSSTYTITLPDNLPASGVECVTLDDTGQLGSQNCTGGIAGSGSTSDNRIPVFTNSGTQITDSILIQDTSTPSNPALGVEGLLSVGTANGSAPGGVGFYDNSGNGRVALIVANNLSAGYLLKLPTSLDTSGKCLNVGAGGQIGYFPCVSSGGGGGTGVTGSGTTGNLLRWTNGGTSVAGDSVITDDGIRVGIGVAPDVAAVLNVGSSGNFKVTNAGALTVNGISNNSAGVTNAGAIGGVTTLSASGVISSSSNNQALTVSGAPGSSATQSLIQVGGAISGGNSTPSTGGTYIGLNAPNSGAGSTADLINLQKNNASVFKVATNGAVTAGTYNALGLQANATGFQIAGGTASRQLTVTANATIDQNLSTSSSVGFSSLTLSSALGVAYGGTGVAGAPSADGQLLIGSSGGTYTRATLSAGAGVNISNGAGSIQISAPGAGTCSSCADTQLSNLTGTTAIPVNLLPNNAGTINIGSSTVPFKDLFLAGNSSTPGTNNFTITGTATAPRVITLPDASGTVCVAGSCAGLGGGITGSGTNNTIAKFNGTGAVTNSTLSDNGTTVTASGAVSVTGALTAGTVNALGLQANATGFQVSGGTVSKTLSVTENATIDQNLSTSSSVGFSSLTLSSALGVAYGGTGVAGAPSADGQLLIGAAGGSYTRATISAGTGVTITNGAGSIQISASGAGTCSTCANQALSNLSSVSINTSLLTGNATVDLGSTAAPFRDLYVGGTATNNFKFTGVATGGQKTLTLDNLSGRVALVQTGGASTAQTGDTHVSGSLIADTDIQAPVAAINSTASGSTALISASNNNGSFSGNLLDLKYGTPSATSKFTVDKTGAVTITGNVTANGSSNTFANSIQVTTGSVQAPTINATTTLQLGGTDINTAGTLTNVAYKNAGNTFSVANTFSAAGTALTVNNNATISGTATIGTLSVTGNGTVAGGSLTVGTGSNVQGSLILWDGGLSSSPNNTATVQVVGTLGQNTTYTLPDPTVNTAEICVKYSGSSTNCTGIGGGLSGSGSGNHIAYFSGASALSNSIIAMNGANVQLDANAGNDRVLNIAQSTTVGDDFTIQAGQGNTATNQVGGNLILQAGAGGGSGSQGSVVIKANGTDTQQAFVVQASGGASLFTADTTTNKRILIGTGTPSLTTTSGSGNLYVTNVVEIAGRLLVGTALNGIDTNSGQLKYTGSFRNTKTIALAPEFTGMILHADGSSNVGVLTSDYDSSGNHSYYNWTTSETGAQDYDMYVRIPVPRDFDKFNSGGNTNAIICYNVWTDDATFANSVITAQAFDTGNVSAGTFTATPTAANTWQQKCSTTHYSFTTVTVNGSTYVNLNLHFAAASGKNTRIGEITLDYLSSF